MSAVLDKTLDEMFDADADPVSVAEIAATFGIKKNTVLSAIRKGTLPARRVKGLNGRVTLYLVRRRDALLIWGYRIRETTTA